MKALYDFNGPGAEELDLQAGEVLYVTATPDDGWWIGGHLNPTWRQPGKKILPSNFVIHYQPPLA